MCTHYSPCSSQLLLYLKEFSQKMSAKTHEIEKQVDTLVHEAKVSDKALDKGRWSVSTLCDLKALTCFKR